MATKILRCLGFTMTIVSADDPFVPKVVEAQLDETKVSTETESALRKEQKAKATIKKGQRRPTNSSRYREDKDDTRTHRFEDPHKVGRRRETIRLIPAPHPVSFEDFLEELGAESVW